MSETPTAIRLTETAAKQYAEARRIRKWSYKTIAEEAIKALFKSDPELASAVTPDRRRRTSATN